MTCWTPCRSLHRGYRPVRVDCHTRSECPSCGSRAMGRNVPWCALGVYPRYQGLAPLWYVVHSLALVPMWCGTPQTPRNSNPPGPIPGGLLLRGIPILCPFPILGPFPICDMRITFGSVYALSQNLGVHILGQGCNRQKSINHRNFWAVLLVYVVVFHAMGPCESLGRW